MIFLCNTFITETKPRIGKGFVNRQNLKSYSNFDIFKYSLCSMSGIYNWSKVIINIELDAVYENRRDELEKLIRDEFRGKNLILNWSRNYYQKQWKETYDLLDDDLIWFYCNHDHIFIDNDYKYLSSLVDIMRNYEEDVSLAFSHWPECIRTASSGGSSPPFDSRTYSVSDSHIRVKNNCFDSIQIIKKSLYKKWWFEGEFGHVKLPRPDYFGVGLAELKPVPLHDVIIPLKELCRHFDGYYHCSPAISNKVCPSLEIPNGFFENNIRVEYGPKTDDRPAVNLDPKNEYYLADDNSGTDYKWNLDDIPLFWKNRITNKKEQYQLTEELIQYRLKSISEMVLFDGFLVEDKVHKKILNLYCQNYKGFGEFTID